MPLLFDAACKNETLTGDRGSILFHHLPYAKYAPNLNCKWTIEVHPDKARALPPSFPPPPPPILCVHLLHDFFFFVGLPFIFMIHLAASIHSPTPTCIFLLPLIISFTSFPISTLQILSVLLLHLFFPSSYYTLVLS